MSIQIGSVVEWDSQSQGNRELKNGTVVFILTSQDGLSPKKIAERIFPGHNLRFKGDKIPGKADVGYLIEVKTGRNRKPKLYLPWLNKLKLIK